MSNKKISEFPVINTLDPSDIFLMDHLGSTSTTHLSTLSDKIISNMPVYDSIPIGSINLFSSPVAPVGYLECDGQIVSKSTYSDLWSTIGDTYSAVALSAAHFRVPDLRGEFIRGWDHNKGVDVGRVFGSNQSHSIQDHHHNLNLSAVYSTADLPANTPIATLGGDPKYTNPDTHFTPLSVINNRDYIAGIRPSVGINISSETRPNNVALLPCIKALRTVTGITNVLNFIPKPTSPAPNDKDVLFYDNSTSTWSATALSAVITQTNVVKSTSITKNATGTSITFTDIPPTAKKINIIFNNVSLTGGDPDNIRRHSICRFGTSSQIYTSGYISGFKGVAAYDIDSGIWLASNINNGTAAIGNNTITKIPSTNTWNSVGINGNYNLSNGVVGTLYHSFGLINLNEVLTHLVITTHNATDVFDNGTITITYEE